MRTAFALAALPLLAAALPVQAGGGPSFDCRKATRIDEKLICADLDLSWADTLLDAAYGRLMEELARLDPTARDRLRAEQRAWVRGRAEACGIEPDADPAELRDYRTPCLLEVYAERQRELDYALANLPYAAGVTEERVAGTDPDVGLAVAVGYPQIPEDSLPGAAGFNRAAEALADRWIETAKAQARTAVPFPGEPDQTSYLGTRWTLPLITPRLVSAEFRIERYQAGAAHGMTSTHVLNFDPAAGREIGPADLFAGTEWVPAVSAHALEELRRRGHEQDMVVFEMAEEMVPQAVGDLTRWRFERDRAVVSFDPYEVAAYAFGIQEVAVPYPLIEPYLRPDAPIPPD